MILFLLVLTSSLLVDAAPSKTKSSPVTPRPLVRAAPRYAKKATAPQVELSSTSQPAKPTSIAGVADDDATSASASLPQPTPTVDARQAAAASLDQQLSHIEQKLSRFAAVSSRLLHIFFSFTCVATRGTHAAGAQVSASTKLCWRNCDRRNRH